MEGNVSLPVIYSKIRPPMIHHHVLKRPRLLEKMNQTFSAKVTVVTAAAGYGKTTLVSEWVQQPGITVSWISLDEGDHSIQMFWSQIIHALSQHQDKVGEKSRSLLMTPIKPAIEEIISVLINELSYIPDKMVLVLDDYQFIRKNEIHESLQFFIRHLPAHIHLCLISRNEIPFSLAKMRVTGQLIEITATDLALTKEETAQFLSENLSEPVAERCLDYIYNVTEGWFTGVQLAAMTLQERDSHNRIYSLDNLISGAKSIVSAYLMEEVFLHLPEEIQSFLLHTSILEQKNESLCEAITGFDHVSYCIDWLQQNNLFIVSLDNERSWFRYHPLFSEFLRHYLTKSYPRDYIDQLHRKASQWYEQNKVGMKAIEHAVLAGDYSRAVAQIVKFSIQLLREGQYPSLIKWIEQIPEKWIQTPEVLIIYGWTLALNDDFDGALRILELLESKINECDDIFNEKIAQEISVIRSFIMFKRKDYVNDEQGLDLFKNLTNSTYLLFQSPIEFNPGEASYLRGFLGICGRIKIAGTFYDNYIKFIHDSGRSEVEISGHYYMVRGEIAYERNDFLSALEHVKKAMNVAEKTGNQGLLIPACILSSRLSWISGCREAAVNMLQRVKNSLDGENERRWGKLLDAALIRYYINLHDQSRVNQWLNHCELDVTDDFNTFQEYEYVTLARALMYLDRTEEAAFLLERLLLEADNEHRYGTMIEILNLQAINLMDAGRKGRAVEKLSQSLIMGKAEGYLRIFIDEGEKMQQLLDLLAAWTDQGHYPSELKDYVENLLSLFDDKVDERKDRAGGKENTLLTKREFEVLQLVAGGLTNQQIADHLYLSLGTVKIHLNRVYGKLNVSNRVQAIAEAKKRNMVE